MIFFARLKRNSSIYTDWHMENRIAGFIDGILFKLSGSDYVTDELDSYYVNKVNSRKDQAIELEMISVKPPIPEPQGGALPPPNLDITLGETTVEDLSKPVTRRTRLKKDILAELELKPKKPSRPKLRK